MEKNMEDELETGYMQGFTGLLLRNLNLVTRMGPSI